ncbi:hypothetical protein KQI52_10120 [bacterium]|nr:hypothetical protein [bacterium]
MFRPVTVILLLLLLAVPLFAGDGGTPVPWRENLSTSSMLSGDDPDPELASVEQISAFLTDGQKPPERGFDEEQGQVYSVGLTEEERAYLAKQPSEAFLRSAVLPGWGQRYGDRNFRGAIFSGVEVGLWTALLLTRQDWIEGEDDYMTFARQHAGVSGSPDHQYFVDIGNYNTMDEFNEAQRAQRQYADQYRSSSSYWEWDSSKNRERFKDIRIDADASKRRIYYFVGGLVLNRVLSSIDASRGLAKRQKDLREKEAGFSFGVGYNAYTRGPALTIGW